MSTKNKKPTERDFFLFCEEIGFRFYQTGTLKNKDGSKAGLFLKGDFLSDVQKGALVDRFGGWVSFLKARAQYAPESVKPVILLRSKKEMERGAE